MMAGNSSKYPYVDQIAELVIPTKIEIKPACQYCFLRYTEANSTITIAGAHKEYTVKSPWRMVSKYVDRIIEKKIDWEPKID